jgi:bacteriorhodopsin
MGLLIRDNDALNVNPPAGDQYLTTHGSDWLWAVTAVFIISLLAWIALTYVARSGEKIFHYLFGIALFVGAIAYFSMASDIGYSVIPQADNLGYGMTRQIFFPKYIFWVVAFPAIIIALGLLSGVSWATIFYNVTLSWIWIVSYLCSAYTYTNYKWGFYAFGTFAWLLLAINTLWEGHRSATRVGVARDHVTLAGWVNLLWLLYPIAFGLSDGGNRIGETSSTVFFGVLDVLLVPFLSYAFLILARRWDYNRLNLAFTQYGRVRTDHGAYPEKSTAAPATTGGVVPANGEHTTV